MTSKALKIARDTFFLAKFAAGLDFDSTHVRLRQKLADRFRAELRTAAEKSGLSKDEIQTLIADVESEARDAIARVSQRN